MFNPTLIVRCVTVPFMLFFQPRRIKKKSKKQQARERMRRIQLIMHHERSHQEAREQAPNALPSSIHVNIKTNRAEYLNTLMKQAQRESRKTHVSRLRKPGYNKQQHRVSGYSRGMQLSAMPC